MTTERKPHSVIFRFYQPAEANIVVDAESPDHAKQLVQAMIQDRYKESEIIDAYEVDLTGVDDELLDPYFKAKEKLN